MLMFLLLKHVNRCVGGICVTSHLMCLPLQKAKHALLLTGTPALSRPIELFKQVLG